MLISKSEEFKNIKFFKREKKTLDDYNRQGKKYGRYIKSIFSTKDYIKGQSIKYSVMGKIKYQYEKIFM